MSREILFRGRRMNIKGEQLTPNEWVYGNLIQNSNNQFFIRCLEEDGYDANYLVDPETVGQYTGLINPEGARIFEGDILIYLITDELTYDTGIVKFGQYRNSRGEVNVGFYIQWTTSKYRTDLGYWSKITYCSIKGNIHDTPLS